MIALSAVIEQLCARGLLIEPVAVPPTAVLRDCYQMTLYNRIETCRRHHQQD